MSDSPEISEEQKSADSFLSDIFRADSLICSGVDTPGPSQLILQDRRETRAAALKKAADLLDYGNEPAQLLVMAEKDMKGEFK